MNKKLLGSLLIASLFVAGSALADPITLNTHVHSNSSNSSSNSSSSSGSTSGSTSSSGGSSSGAQSGSGGNSLTTGPTVNLPSDPQTNYFSAGNIIVGGGGQSPSVFVVMPRVYSVAPGVEVRDGAVYVDGAQRSCDQDRRGGLPKCW